MDCTKCRAKSCRSTESCSAQKFDAGALKLAYHLPDNQRVIQAAAALVDNGKAGTLSRLQEIIEFSETLDFHRIGIAYCYGMEEDAALISRILDESGFKTYPISCTTGGFKQSEVNDTSKNLKVSCNPLAQAEQINKEDVDLTITMGLCLGHDIIFNKKINSYTTNLVVKDRVHNNPLSALKKLTQ